MRTDAADDVTLDRTHVRHGRAGLEMRRDVGGDLPHHTDGHAENDQIRSLDRLLRGLADTVAQTDAPRRLTGFRRAGIA